ncbi:Hypothetical_protein [Hexamita inflata]|uniref:Hypothetical_protein n=1 Tax=Hexamita inflata TaxID=28002 RepID=A0AA86Q181_9EUKA|nr:Hypothetical protein HINF_LOCUS9252 [Hexamita inflata]CAI9950249.1 Hypothetical protein HINF_LOCUS37894 [Hexamita inflata]
MQVKDDEDDDDLLRHTMITNMYDPKLTSQSQIFYSLSTEYLRKQKNLQKKFRRELYTPESREMRDYVRRNLPCNVYKAYMYENDEANNLIQRPRDVEFTAIEAIESSTIQNLHGNRVLNVNRTYARLPQAKDNYISALPVMQKYEEEYEQFKKIRDLQQRKEQIEYEALEPSKSFNRKRTYFKSSLNRKHQDKAK